MEKIAYNFVVVKPYCNNALFHYPDFKKDYLVIHSLLKRYQPRTFMEIGTSNGVGTNIICNALGIRKFPGKRLLVRLIKTAQKFKIPLMVFFKLMQISKYWGNSRKVYSIDLPIGTNQKLIYPDGDSALPPIPGQYCHYNYFQLFGDSTHFNYTPYYPLEAWFIDGKHTYEYAQRDTQNALKAKAKLIIWHDMQIKGVEEAVLDVMKDQKYEVFRVIDTRIAYAIKIKN